MRHLRRVAGVARQAWRPDAGIAMRWWTMGCHRSRVTPRVPIETVIDLGAHGRPLRRVARGQNRVMVSRERPRGARPRGPQGYG